MRHTATLLAAVLLTGAAAIAQQRSADPTLRAAIAAPTRTPANVARDRYRHPAGTLAFFGLRPDQTVVEIWPSGGWYTEILAPYLRARGTYWAAVPSLPAKGIDALKAAHPGVYDHVRPAVFPAADGARPAVPAGTADLVLTFRNVHNWRFGPTDRTQAAFDQMFAMLKPGGTLGVVEHRLPEDQAGVSEGQSGYMKRSSVVAFATRAGFRLAGESRVNANPRDTHDHPRGVWNLPPSYRDGDADRARYAAIGESDRMTLKFVKPR